VSNPGGIGAPVKMRTAVPAALSAPAAMPAASRPATGSRVSPLWERSSKRTA
jgi:hypothetical protein